MVTIFIYIALVCLGIFDLYLIVKLLEYACCVIVQHQPPMVASSSMLRRYVVEQIMTHYPKSKNICEIGSGFGGLARTVACNTKANVYALENMPFSVFISKASDILSGCKNNKTIWCDAFQYLDTTNIKFDVAIAYLGPTATPMLQKYKDKIKVLISLDFEITGLRPTRIIDIGHGYTRYKMVKYPHKLLVYEFK